MHSRRTDGRGHWPRGTRRHPKPDGRMMRAFTRLVCSAGLRPVARRLKVDHRTVYRWLYEDDYPSQANAARIARLVREGWSP